LVRGPEGQAVRMRTITIEVPVELPGDQVFARLTEQAASPK
jgi:hypothetical protein